MAYATNIVDTQPQSNDPKHLVSAEITLGGAPAPKDVSVKEVIVGESLLNPSVHCAVTLQSTIYNDPNSIPTPKDWDQYKGQALGLYITDKEYRTQSNSKNLPGDNPREMRINQTIYRCDNRRFSNLNTGQVEDLTLHTIDNSILEDARTIMSQSWKCSTPSTIVRQALQKIGASTRYVESSGPAKDYVAESIHPLQVIQQQANMALYNGEDPSFVHYMTINEATGENRHHFAPLGRLIKQNAGYKIYGADTGISGGTSFSDGFNIAVTYNFPCDYDLLSDILNGIGPDGKNLNAFKGFNMVSGAISAIGAAAGGDFSQAANIFTGMTSKGTSQAQNACESEIEKWLLTRQARMGLLEKDKIALRVTVPWSPWLHAGNVFRFQWDNRYNSSQQIYGTGDYLIVHLTHNIQFGGYATTTLDCIANTYGT